ncbi:TonB-dependent receptor [Fibrella sp. ES10-3-2-2]
MRATMLPVLLTAILAGSALAHNSAGQTLLDQPITIKAQNQPLPTVLATIERATGLRFTYVPALVEGQQRVSFDAQNEKLNSVLDRLLRPIQIDYSLRKRYIILKKSPAIPVQPLKVALTDITEAPTAALLTGRITSDVGETLPGVSVVLKGTSTGTTTDVNGRYSLNVPSAGSTLVFSYIGFITQEIVVGSRTSLDVVLQTDNKTLSEVVVVGYGTQQKKDVTSAIAQVDGQEIRKSAAVSISNSLAGRVPGLIVNQRNAEPGRDDAAIFIRGIGTTGNSAALIVVDGVANRDGISRIDPNDIETVTVLKDASAAIYGAQAANGVVLITTRRGKAGKPVLNYSFNQGFVSPTRVIKMADAATYARSINDLNLQAGQPVTFNDTQIGQYASGQLPSTNWVNESFKDYSIQNRHSLTLSGGTDAVRYFLSGGTAYQNGLLRGDNTTGYRQYNIRTNVDAKISEKLNIGFDLAARRENRNFLQLDQNTVFQAAVLGDPTQPATVNGLPARGRFNNNPLAIAQGTGYDKLERNVVNGTLKYTYKLPVPGLFIDGFAALDFFQDFQKIWAQPHTFYEANASGTVLPIKASITPSLQQTFIRTQSLTLNSKINYERTFGQHNVSAFVAYEQNQTRADNFLARRNGFESPQIDQLFAGSQTNQVTNGSASQGARQNYFGRVSYGYQDKYLAQVYFRYDGSQIFPEGKRFGFFPGASLGWRISEESFLKNNPVVSNLKLRASWGQLGNDRVAQYQFLNIFTFGNGYVVNGQDVLALNPGVAANPNITWEKQTNLDIGIEAGFFKNRLTFEGDVFYNKRTDILAARNVTVPQYTGLTLPSENIGKVDNRGFDAQLTYRTSWKGARFNISGNVTYARNKVVFIDEGNVFRESYQKLEGQPVGSLLVYDVLGIYQTSDQLTTIPGLAGSRVGDLIYRDVNGDGVVNSDDRIRLDRNATPQLQYGLNLGAEFKGFDLTALFQGQAQAVQEITYNFSLGSNGPDYFLANAWTPTNTGASLPRIGRSKQTNNLWVRDVSFVRLKNVELGYTVPRPLLSRLGVQTLRFYVNGYNLLTFDSLKKDGLPDPENVNIQGWQYPHTKSINFGLNLTF